MAIISDYNKEQCLEILIFDKELIDRIIDVEDTIENCKKLQLDMYAVREDLDLVIDLLNSKQEG